MPLIESYDKIPKEVIESIDSSTFCIHEFSDSE